MISLNVKKVLVISPHADDGELACGGTIHRFIESGLTVYYVAFSICEESLPDGYPRYALEQEMRASMSVLGIPQDNYRVYGYAVRWFDSISQQILENLVTLREMWNPDMVLCPASTDIHQDHKVLYYEAMRAFKTRILLGYEHLAYNRVFQPNIAISISEKNLETKIQAIEVYKTQADREHMDADYIRSLAILRGKHFHVPLAEAFEVINLMSI